MIEIFVNLFIFWFVYSFIGWICEVIYAKAMKKGFDVRNATLGPINPGYGIAAIIIITVLGRHRENPIFVFFAGAIIASILEFFTHLFFEKLAGVKLWDYSEKRFNLQGRICLSNSILFGLLVVLMINLVHPIFRQFVYNLSLNIKFLFTYIASVLYIIEMTIIVVSVMGLRSALKEAVELWNIIKSAELDNNKSFREFMKNETNKNINWYKQHNLTIPEKLKNIKPEPNDNDYTIEQNILSLRLSQLIQDKFTKKNLYQKILYNVFPDLKSTNYEEIYEVLKETYANK